MVLRSSDDIKKFFDDLKGRFGLHAKIEEEGQELKVSIPNVTKFKQDTLPYDNAIADTVVIDDWLKLYITRRGGVSVQTCAPVYGCTEWLAELVQPEAIIDSEFKEGSDGRGVYTIKFRPLPSNK